MVGHTRASKALGDGAVNDWLGIATDEMLPAAGKVSLLVFEARTPEMNKSADQRSSSWMPSSNGRDQMSLMRL